MATEGWKEFLLSDLFERVERGSRLKIEHRISGDIPLVTAGCINKGIVCTISNDENITYRNAITIDMFGNAFYHSYEFKCDDNILVMSNEYLNDYVGNFLVSCILKDKYKYSYANQYRVKNYKEHRVLLPVTVEGKPNYDYMETYMKWVEQEAQKRLKKLWNIS